jgi:3',5'-nucleoside bisphosphate phosphatase
MQWFKADLHIHTVLSPCGGLDMSPVNIIKQAVAKNLDIIAITDHNSTRHCRVSQEIGRKSGITVIAGAEINSKEEIHCLTFFENLKAADLFQQYIDVNLPEIPNKPEVFGNQFIVDEEENILDEENRLLIVALQAGIDEIAEKVRELKGIFIPAHVNRKSNSLYSQLGFMPADFDADALEVAVYKGSENFVQEHPETGKYCLVANSDAHCLEMIGMSFTEYYLEKPGFAELKLALKAENGRKVKAL